MITLFRSVGVLYIASGLWCAFQLELATNFLGFYQLTGKGEGEFFSVYGGLQVGIGVAMVLSSLRENYREASIYFSAIFSTSLVVFRLGSFVLYEGLESFAFMAVLEILIAFILWKIWFGTRTRKS